MKTISLAAVLLILALVVLIASPPVMANAHQTNDQTAVNGTQIDIDQGITQDNGPPCHNYFAICYRDFTAEENVITATIANQMNSGQTTSGQAQAINTRFQDNTYKTSYARGVPATARNAVIQVAVRAIGQNYEDARAYDAKEEVARFEPEMVCGFHLSTS